MKIILEKKRIEIPARKVGLFGKIRGLMFRSRNCENLLFNFSSSEKFGIHSFFVFFDFLAVWLDEGNRVLEWEVVKPWRFLVRPKTWAVKLLEVPLNDKNSLIFNLFRR